MSLVQVGDQLWIPDNFEEKHAYYADPEGTKEYTGITTVLKVLAKEALYEWYARMVCEYIMANARKSRAKVPSWLVNQKFLIEEARLAGFKRRDTAAAHGTDAHALVEKWIKLCLLNNGDPVTEVLEYGGGEYEPIKQFIEWAGEHVGKFLFAERRMADSKLFIAGTADFAYIGKDGKRYMGDFKTSSGIYGIDYWLQVAGYRLLAEANGDLPYEGSVIVRLGKDGSFEYQTRYDYETDKNALLACLTIYRAQGTYKKPKKTYEKKA